MPEILLNADGSLHKILQKLNHNILLIDPKVVASSQNLEVLHLGYLLGSANSRTINHNILHNLKELQ